MSVKNSNVSTNMQLSEALPAALLSAAQKPAFAKAFIANSTF